MNRKMLANVLIATMGIACLTGCGQKAQEQTETSQNVSQSDEREVLTVWTRDATAPATIAAAEKYNQSQDKVTVNVVQQVSKEMANQFTLALSAKEAPDIIALDCTKIPYFAANGAYMDISDRFESLDYKDQFSAGMVKSGQIDGKTYAIPFSPDVSVLLYNKEHYREAGLDPETPPTTWDELIDYSKKLTKDGRYGYVYAGSHASAYMFTFMPYVWNNGGDVLSEDGKKCLINSENAIEAIQLMSDMINEYKVTPPCTLSYSWGEAQDAFLTGQASQIVLGSAAIYGFVNGASDMDWGAALIPKGPNGTGYASFSGEDSIGITSQCKDPDAAWDFIEYALSEDVQVEELAKGGCLPARKDFFDNKYFAETPQYQVLKEALNVSHTPYSLKYDEMYTPILEDMQSCMNQQMTAADAAADIAERIDAIMAE